MPMCCLLKPSYLGDAETRRRNLSWIGISCITDEVTTDTKRPCFAFFYFNHMNLFAPMKTFPKL
uniref:Uncharacterized protein n=1 Tax=Mesocestoides corti TaxID=53468 RepID=A0A5K3EPV5_MESCO